MFITLSARARLHPGDEKRLDFLEIIGYILFNRIGRT